jgi:hypothetical protein
MDKECMYSITEASVPITAQKQIARYKIRPYFHHFQQKLLFTSVIFSRLVHMSDIKVETAH